MIENSVTRLDSYGMPYIAGMLGQAAQAYQASQEAYASSGDLAAAAAAAAGGGYSLRRWA